VPGTIPPPPSIQERDAVHVLYRSDWFREAAEPFSIALQLMERLAKTLDDSQIDLHYVELEQKIQDWEDAHRVTVSGLRHGPTLDGLSVLTTVDDLIVEYENAAPLYRRELRHTLGVLAYARLVDELRIRQEDRGADMERAPGEPAREISTAEADLPIPPHPDYS
jgi:hypothetical protein